jgi:hypothetical protein
MDPYALLPLGGPYGRSECAPMPIPPQLAFPPRQLVIGVPMTPGDDGSPQWVLGLYAIAATPGGLVGRWVPAAVARASGHTLPTPQDPS